MATIKLYEALDLVAGTSGSWGLSGYQGAVYDDSTWLASAGGDSEYWTGTLTFPYNPIYGTHTPAGLITSVSAYDDGVLALTLDGVMLDAYSRFQELNGSGNAFGSSLFAGADTVVGSAGNDKIAGYAGNDTLNGGAGTDTAVFANAMAAYGISGSAGNWVVTHNANGSGAEGSDTLASMERLEFADRKLAFDLGAGEAGGQAALLVGACLGAAGVADSAVVAAVLSLFDAGFDMTAITDLLVSSGIVAQLAGGADNGHFVDWIYGNVVGGVLEQGLRSDLVAILDNDSLSQGQFLAAIAAMDINQANIGLVGLQQSGLEYA